MLYALRISERLAPQLGVDPIQTDSPERSVLSEPAALQSVQHRPAVEFAWKRGELWYSGCA